VIEYDRTPSMTQKSWRFHMNSHAPGIGASAAMKIHEFCADIPDPVVLDGPVPVDREGNRLGAGTGEGGNPSPREDSRVEAVYGSKLI